MCLFKTFSNLLRKEEKDDNINQLAEFKTTFVILANFLWPEIDGGKNGNVLFLPLNYHVIHCLETKQFNEVWQPL